MINRPRNVGPVDNAISPRPLAIYSYNSVYTSGRGVGLNIITLNNINGLCFQHLWQPQALTDK